MHALPTVLEVATAVQPVNLHAAQVESAAAVSQLMDRGDDLQRPRCEIPLYYNKLGENCICFCMGERSRAKFAASFRKFHSQSGACPQGRCFALFCALFGAGSQRNIHAHITM